LSRAARVLLTLAGLAAACPQAGAGGFGPEAFAAFVDAQGERAAPRLYAYRGEVYDVPGGQLVATVEGYQQARVFPVANARSQAFVARRAVLLYRAPGTGAVLRVYPDVRASVTAPPLGLVRYTLSGDEVRSESVSGTRAAARSLDVPENLDAHREGADWVFRRVLRPPNPVEQPVEIQESVVRPGPGPASGRIRSVMTKVANNTVIFAPGGRHVLHLVWRPVENWSALPPGVREFLDREAPGMKTLPASLEDSLAELGLPAFPSVGPRP
jgi:hypothetical protein